MMQGLTRIIMIVLMVGGVIAAVAAPDSAGLIITYILFIVAALAAVVFPIIYTIKHPAAAKRSLIGIGIMLAIVLLAYLLSDSTPPANTDITEGSARFVSTGLTLLYILFIGAIVAAIYSEVSRLFK